MESKKCDICQEKANIICLKCNSYYCEECFKYVHNKPANLEHKKDRIDPYVPIETKCKFHNFPLNLFCITEKGNKYFCNDLINNNRYRTLLLSLYIQKTSYGT